MASSILKDTYANKFYCRAVESAANTCTYAEIPTNTDIFSKVVFLIQRLEIYFTRTTFNLLLATNDEINVALTASNKILYLDSTYRAYLSDPAIIDLTTFGLGTFGAAASGFPLTWPYIKDFSSLPGGGLLVAARPLYIGIQGYSLATAADVFVRGFFTRKELKTEEYLDLVDYYRMIS